MPELGKRGKQWNRIDPQRAMELWQAGKSDREIAEALGCSYRGVQSWRMRHRLPANSDRQIGRGITAEYERLYGQGLSDKEIAVQLGVSRQNVQSWRFRTGRSCHREAERFAPLSAQFQALYDKGLTDREIAEATGASISSVGHWRWRNNLAVHPAASDGGGRPKVNGPLAQRHGAMFMSDDEILYSWRMALDRREQVKILAELNATSVQNILEKLELLGIDASPYRKKRKGKLDEEKALDLWQQGLDDAAIGRRFGICDSSVKQWREACGLHANAGRGRPTKDGV